MREQKKHMRAKGTQLLDNRSALMIKQGFNPETSTVEEFVEISERAETKGNICQECKRFFNSHDSSSSDDQQEAEAS
jgi:hypothetical protein